MKEEFKSRVYTDRPDYADFEPPYKFETIKAIATLTDYGNIKILDFKEPNSSHYRIRFLFEEDYCKLHISGDLGELIASNYSNMTYEKFSDFTNDIGYFEGKIDCHSRNLYYYDYDEAKKDLRKFIEEHNLAKSLMDSRYDLETLDDVIDEILEDFDIYSGIGQTGSHILLEVTSDDYDVYRLAAEAGKRSTGILDLYMLAFKLARKSLAEHVEIISNIHDNPELLGGEENG